MHVVPPMLKNGQAMMASGAASETVGRSYAALRPMGVMSIDIHVA